MARKTIKGELLKWWEARSVVSFTEASAEYYMLSSQLGYYASWDYISMNLTRILKESGRKLGPAGSRAKWRFGKTRRVEVRVVIESGQDDFLDMPIKEVCDNVRDLFEPEDGESVRVYWAG